MGSEYSCNLGRNSLLSNVNERSWWGKQLKQIFWHIDVDECIIFGEKLTQFQLIFEWNSGMLFWKSLEADCA